MNQQESWLSSLLDEIEEGAWSVDAKTEQFLYLNHGAEKIYGRPKDEFYAYPELRLEVIHAETERDRQRLSLAQLLENEQLENQYEIIRPDGEIRLIREKIYPVTDANGELIRLDGIIRGITETKTPKNAQNLTGVIYQYIYHRDGREEIPYISRSCEKLYELTAEEIQENPALMWAFVDPKTRDAFKNSLATCAKNLTQWQWQWKQITPAGSVKWLSAVAEPQAQENGDISWYGFILEIVDFPADLEPRNGGIGDWRLSENSLETLPANRSTDDLIRSLKESEAIYRSVFNAIPQGLLIQDANGQIRDCNQTAENILGLTSAQIIGNPGFFVPIPANNSREFFGNGKGRNHHVKSERGLGSKSVKGNLQGIHKADGTLSWISVNAQPLVDLQIDAQIDAQIEPQVEAQVEAQLEAQLDTRKVNNSVALISFHEVTDRLQQESKLRETVKHLTIESETFRATFEQAGVGIAHLKFDGTWLNVNPRLCCLLGYSSSELLKLRYQEMIHPDDAPLSAKYRRQLLAGEIAIATQDVRFQHKNGHWVWMNAIVSLVQTSCGKPQYLIAVIDDITTRHQDIESLRESEKHYKTIVDFTYDWEYWIDADGKLLYISAACERITGYRADDFLADPQLFTQIIHPHDRERVEKSLQPQSFHPDKLTTKIEFRIITKNGSIRWISQLSQSVHDFEGRWRGLRSSNRDITDQKESEKILQEQEQFLRSIYNGVEQAIFVVDVFPKGNFRYIGLNPAAERLVGIGSADIAGKTFEDVYGPNTAQFVRDHYTKCLQSATSRIYEEYQVFKGVESWSMTTLTPLRNEHNLIYRIIGTTIDITERKKAEIEQQKLVTIIENSSDFIALASSEGKPFFLNPAGRKMVDITADESVEKLNMFKFFMAEDLPVVLSEILPAVLETGSWQGEFRLKNFKTGQPISVEYNVFLVKDPQTNKSIGFATVSRNITQYKEFVQALQKSEQKFRELAAREALQNRIGNLIRHSLDIQSIVETVIQQISGFLQIDHCFFMWLVPNQKEVTWDLVSEVKNTSLPNLINTTEFLPSHPLTKQLLNLHIFRVDDISNLMVSGNEQISSLGYRALLALPFETRSGKIGVIGCGHSHGSEHWQQEDVEMLQSICSQVAIAINQAELYSQSVESARIANAKSQELETALRELKQTQANLIQAEKMSSLGQMVAGVAHEINNPIGFIYGNLKYARDYANDLLKIVQLYRETYSKPTPKIAEVIEELDLDFLVVDLPKLLDSMKVGAERIREIVKSLRTFSRLDESDMKRVDLHENQESTLMILQPRLKKTSEHPAIHLVKDYGELPLIECYAGQLNQVFMNLLANAIDALEELDKTRTESEILINPSMLKISTQMLENDWVQIRIQDNGIGIKPDAISKIFDPFYTSKPVGKGTGLGLSISYQIIVERHHGTMRCISESEKGTEFIVEIPGSQKN
jgi:PAS domain S-box-containing protein